MNQIFICGSLEPGRDGVGDYSRMMAAALIERGAQVALLAFNDAYMEGISLEEQEQRGVHIHALRMGRNEAAGKRVSEAKKWIDQLDPEWLSLQFVPYAFHKKGLPWRCASQMQKIGKGRKWHIMFHELWVGMSKTDKPKRKIYGWGQKQIIRNMIYSLKPEIIHTQTHLYQAYLHQMNLDVKYLPLFSNIASRANESLDKKGKIKIAIFGSLHAGANFTEFIDWLLSREIINFEFCFLGDNGLEQKKWLEVLQKRRIPYKLYGWLSERMVSHKLSQCSWGLTSTPYSLVEKSGSVAAMLEHGLRVYCIGRDWKPRGICTDPSGTEVIEWNPQLDFNKLCERKVTAPHRRLPDVARRLVLDLSKN